MLISDLYEIGNNLYKIRKARGLTQAEVAEKAELSDRAYADIERGTVNMRVETLIKICNALSITPNDILIVQQKRNLTEAEISVLMNKCSENERQTALKLLNVFLESLQSL